MAKFKVHMQRYVEETATIEIEADTVEQAVDEAEGMSDSAECVWKPADEIVYGSVMEIGDGSCYAAHDENGAHVWERSTD